MACRLSCSSDGVWLNYYVDHDMHSICKWFLFMTHEAMYAMQQQLRYALGLTWEQGADKFKHESSRTRLQTRDFKNESSVQNLETKSTTEVWKKKCHQPRIYKHIKYLNVITKLFQKWMNVTQEKVSLSSFTDT